MTTKELKGSAKLLHDDCNIVDATIFVYEALQSVARHLDESDLEGICIALAGEKLHTPVGPALERVADALFDIAAAIRERGE